MIKRVLNISLSLILLLYTVLTLSGCSGGVAISAIDFKSDKFKIMLQKISANSAYTSEVNSAMDARTQTYNTLISQFSNTNWNNQTQQRTEAIKQYLTGQWDQIYDASALAGLQDNTLWLTSPRILLDVYNYLEAAYTLSGISSRFNGVADNRYNWYSNFGATSKTNIFKDAASGDVTKRSYDGFITKNINGVTEKITTLKSIIEAESEALGTSNIIKFIDSADLTTANKNKATNPTNASTFNLVQHTVNGDTGVDDNGDNATAKLIEQFKPDDECIRCAKASYQVGRATYYGYIISNNAHYSCPGHSDGGNPPSITYCTNAIGCVGHWDAVIQPVQAISSCFMIDKDEANNVNKYNSLTIAEDKYLVKNKEAKWSSNISGITGFNPLTSDNTVLNSLNANTTTGIQRYDFNFENNKTGLEETSIAIANYSKQPTEANGDLILSKGIFTPGASDDLVTTGDTFITSNASQQQSTLNYDNIITQCMGNSTFEPRTTELQCDLTICLWKVLPIISIRLYEPSKDLANQLAESIAKEKNRGNMVIKTTKGQVSLKRTIPIYYIGAITDNGEIEIYHDGMYYQLGEENQLLGRCGNSQDVWDSRIDSLNDESRKTASSWYYYKQDSFAGGRKNALLLMQYEPLYYESDAKRIGSGTDDNDEDGVGWEEPMPLGRKFYFLREAISYDSVNDKYKFILSGQESNAIGYLEAIDETKDKVYLHISDICGKQEQKDRVGLDVKLDRGTSLDGLADSSNNSNIPTEVNLSDSLYGGAFNASN